VAVEPTLGSQDQYFYRNKMEFSFGPRWLTQEEISRRQETTDRFALGLHLPERFDRTLDVEECWLQSETSVQLVNAVREFCRNRGLSIYSTITHTGFLRHLVIREGKRTGERMVNLVTSTHEPALMLEFRDFLLGLFPDLTTICNNITSRKSLVATGEREVVLHGTGTIAEHLCGMTFRISANSFFQSNTVQAERLYAEVRRLAGLTPEDVVYDCYCGTGTISLVLAGDASEVVGIESVPDAVEDARKNAEINSVRNCTFLVGDLKETLARESAGLAPGRPSVVVLDPPRAGIHESVVSTIRTFSPRRIVYVSCNPATLARDLARLCAGGVYDITWVRPFDMFPQTFHIEAAVCLDREHSPGTFR
jgi:23S rRNA (uracil1939-C5)-methyltransferase